jgi:glycyl-tRNA synthetase beta chain
LEINLRDLIKFSSALYGNEAQIMEIESFFEERIRYYLKNSYDMSYIDALMHSALTNPWLLISKLNVLMHFFQTLESKKLLAVYKRVRNIVGTTTTSEVCSTLLLEPQELALHAFLLDLKPKITSLMLENKFEEVLTELVKLHEPLEQFFENIMVMVDDKSLQSARINLLLNVKALCDMVVDLGNIME